MEGPMVHVKDAERRRIAVRLSWRSIPACARRVPRSHRSGRGKEKDNDDDCYDDDRMVIRRFTLTSSRSCHKALNA